MDHEQIDRLDLIDRYVMGKLPAEECAVFEEHFVDCPECIARLQTTKAFLKDLRLVAAEQAAQIEPRSARSASPHGLKSFLLHPVTWAAACLLIAGVTVALFVNDHTRRLRDEVAQAESLSEQWQRRYEDERQSAMSADQMHRAAEAERAEQLRALEARLKQQDAMRAETRAKPAGRLPSEGNLLLFILNSVRSSGPDPAGPVNQIDLPRTAVIFAFSIAPEEERQYETYRITIFDDRRRLVWKRGELTPGPQGALSIWLKASLFRPGDYDLVVEGVNKEGEKNEVGNYPFLIVKSP